MRGRILMLLACVGVLLATAWYVGSRFDPPPRPAAGTVRLGPEPGEAVTDYLARLPAELPAPGEPVLALVQFRTELTLDGATALLGAAPAALSAVFHVPLPRVQTALRFAALEPGALAGALDTAREQARFAAGADADRRTGRAAAVARAEAAALADPACDCVVAIVVRADRAGLAALAALPQVRAVHAAPAGVVPAELALAPVLPGQTERADPLPDDGPAPPPPPR